MFGDPRDNPKGYPIKSLSEIASYWNGLTYKPKDVADFGTIVLVLIKIVAIVTLSIFFIFIFSPLY